MKSVLVTVLFLVISTSALASAVGSSQMYSCGSLKYKGKLSKMFPIYKVLARADRTKELITIDRSKGAEATKRQELVLKRQYMEGAIYQAGDMEVEFMRSMRDGKMLVNIKRASNQDWSADCVQAK